uniref:Large ribosomal subunit protein bL34m n=1 Tax=Crocodylus porosus TaxID=8502 RepID=A0A7M4DXC3_CROPO
MLVPSPSGPGGPAPRLAHFFSPPFPPGAGVSGSQSRNSWSRVFTVSGHSSITMWLPSSITFRNAISRIWGVGDGTEKTPQDQPGAGQLCPADTPQLGGALPGSCWAGSPLAPGWGRPPARTKARGNEYQPKNLKRKRTHGWIKRIREASGIRVILRRMLKGRKSLSH